jgi:hypothetical protein
MKIRWLEIVPLYIYVGKSYNSTIQTPVMHTTEHAR